jgi:hypothetical protein
VVLTDLGLAFSGGGSDNSVLSDLVSPTHPADPVDARTRAPDPGKQPPLTPDIAVSQPESAGVHGDFHPDAFDPLTAELDALLSHLNQIGRDLGGWLTGSPWTLWLLVGAGAAGAAETVRRSSARREPELLPFESKGGRDRP